MDTPHDARAHTILQAQRVPGRRVWSDDEIEDFADEMRMDAMLDRDPPED